MRIKFLNGTYDGACDSGVPNGFGIYTAEDGSVYKGEWTDGKLSRGVLHSGERIYIGELRDLLPHGKGCEYVSRYRKFTGRFINGRKSRFGRERKPYNVITSDIKKPMSLIYKEAAELSRGFSYETAHYGDPDRAYELPELSRILGFDVLCLNDGYKPPYGYSENGIATHFCDSTVNGMMILCRDGGDGEPVPFYSAEEAELVYDTIWRELFDPHDNDLYHYANAVEIAAMGSCSSIFLIDDRLYAVEHTVSENTVSDPYEGWQSSRPKVSVRVHPLPPATVEPEEARRYTEEHGEWSEPMELDRECNEADTARRAAGALFEKCIYGITRNK